MGAVSDNTAARVLMASAGFRGTKVQDDVLADPFFVAAAELLANRGDVVSRATMMNGEGDRHDRHVEMAANDTITRDLGGHVLWSGTEDANVGYCSRSRGVSTRRRSTVGSRAQ